MSILNLAAVLVIANVSVPRTGASPFSNNVIITPTPQILIRKVISKVTKTLSASPVASNGSVDLNQTASSNPLTPPPQQNRCIITIDGVQYDVTDFRNIHSGGNIFTCGSDMSQIFWNRHDAAILARMQQYRI